MHIELTLRFLAFLCAALAGWSLGQARPTWQADVEEYEMGYWGCGMFPCIFIPIFPFINFIGGRPLAGTGVMGMFILASLACYVIGWHRYPANVDAWDIASWLPMLWAIIWMCLITDSIFWLLFGTFSLGWLASRLYSIRTGREDFG